MIVVNLFIIMTYPIGYRAFYIKLQLNNTGSTDIANPSFYIDDTYTIIWLKHDQFQFEDRTVLAQVYTTSWNYVSVSGYYDPNGHYLGLTLDYTIAAGSSIIVRILIVETAYVPSSILGLTSVVVTNTPDLISQNVGKTVLEFGEIYVTDLFTDITSMTVTEAGFSSLNYQVDKTLAVYQYSSTAEQDNYVAGGYATPYEDSPLEIMIDYPTSVSGVSIKLEFDQTNFKDWSIDPSTIYFIDQNNNVLYFWIEKWDSSIPKGIIWVKTDIPNTIYMYYGGSNPYSSYNDPTQVFLLYDDFDDGVLDSVYTLFGSSSNLYEDKGCLQIHAPTNGDQETVGINIQFSTDIVIDMKWLMNSTSNGYGWDIWFSSDLVDPQSTTPTDFMRWKHDSFGDPWDLRYRRDGDTAVTTVATGYFYGNTWYIVSYSLGTIYIDNTKESYTVSHGYTTSYAYILLNALPGQNTGNNIHVYIDWIRIRKYIDESNLIITYNVIYPRELHITLPSGYYLDYVDVYYTDSTNEQFTSTDIYTSKDIEKYYIYIYIPKSTTTTTTSTTSTTTTSSTTSTTTNPAPNADLPSGSTNTVFILDESWLDFSNPIKVLAFMGLVVGLILAAAAIMGIYAISFTPLIMIALAKADLISDWIAYLSGVGLVFWIAYRVIRG